MMVLVLGGGEHETDDLGGNVTAVFVHVSEYWDSPCIHQTRNRRKNMLAVWRRPHLPLLGSKIQSRIQRFRVLNTSACVVTLTATSSCGKGDFQIEQERTQSNIASIPPCKRCGFAHVNPVDLGQAADARLD